MEGYGDKMFQIIHICFSMMLELREFQSKSTLCTRRQRKHATLCETVITIGNVPLARHKCNSGNYLAFLQLRTGNKQMITAL